MHAEQIVADMADEILARQAAARARWSGESFEDALSAVLCTEAGRQLQELRDGVHGSERADEWQENLRSFPSGGASRPYHRHESPRTLALDISVNRANGSSLLSRHKFFYVLDLPDVAGPC